MTSWTTSVNWIESEIEGHVRNRHRDAQADVLVGFCADLAGEQILHGAALLAARAAAADAHAASAPRPEPGALCLHQQRDAALATDVLEGPRETQGDLGGVGNGRQARCERLAARELGVTALPPEGVRGIEQATRAAHQRATFGGVRRHAVEVVARETSRQLARERRPARDAEMDMQVRMTLPEVYELAREDQVAMGVCVVREDDIRVDSASEQVAQHRHEGGDAAAARDHEELRRHRVGQDEITERLAELDDVADREMLVQVARHPAPGVTLHGERDGAVGRRRVRRTVSARVTRAVDLDRELYMLAGTKAPPVAVGTQDEAHHVAGLGADRLDPRQDAVQGELRVQPARIEVEHVLVEEHAHDRRGEQAVERCGETDARCRAVLRLRGHSASGWRRSGTGPGRRRAGCAWYVTS